MSAPFALYCKSYRTDLRRVLRLAESVRRFNADQIPFYVSVPQSDIGLFRSHLTGYDVTLVEDEAITAANPRMHSGKLRDLPGSISQQIVKSEFWRLGLADTYICLDSDAVFMRPISQDDFLVGGWIPYTVIDEGHEFIESALRERKNRAVDAFRNVATTIQTLFERPGRLYSFGPFPVLWHRSVWESLEQEFLSPRRWTLLDAIVHAPAESHWYGESLLKYRAIPLHPCQPLFKVYHYAWQFDQDRRGDITGDDLATLYCGVIYQSAWERSMDWPREGGSLGSRLGRRLRRILGRI